jgi:hypothetical protein
MDHLLPSTIAGLPLHPLVVHATVVIVPLASLVVLLAAVLPRFRRWAGWLPPLLALGALVLTPIATSSGENLEHQVENPSTETAIQHHAELGGLLIWWVVPLFLVALVSYAVSRRQRRTAGGLSAPRWLAVALVVLGVAVPVGTLVQVVLIGHSGAEAVWKGVGGS